jgi:hypothetical protein
MCFWWCRISGIGKLASAAFGRPKDAGSEVCPKSPVRRGETRLFIDIIEFLVFVRRF